MACPHCSSDRSVKRATNRLMCKDCHRSYNTPERQAAVDAARAVREARQGVAPAHDMTRAAAPGFQVKGTSTLYRDDGSIAAQWVKTTQDAEAMREALKVACAAMAEDLPRVAPMQTAGKVWDKRLMACYPIGDAHIGMLSWPLETGEEWDLAIAERIQCGAMAALVEAAPKTDKAVIVNLGDWFHYDSIEPVTSRSGHVLDSDGRYAKMIGVGIKVIRQCITSALAKHRQVHVINVIGNHDDTGALWLSAALAHVYESEPRVSIEQSPAPFTYFRHGKTLVGCHHGNTCKPDKLPGVMAADRPIDWGATEHRYWWLGHVHHQSVKEYPGVSVETFGTLAAKDAYATAGGWRAARNMKCIVLHDEHGEVARHAVSPAMLEVR